MELIIKEGNKDELLINNETCYFLLSDYSALNNINSIEDIFKYLIFNDSTIKLYIKDDNDLNYIYQYVIGNISLIELRNSSCINIMMVFIKIYGYLKKYNELINSNINSVIIKCNKSNLLKILSISLTTKKVLIENEDISFKEFYDLLKEVDLKRLDENGIKIKIKECSIPITLSKLYEIILLVKSNVDKINNMNLSPLEKVIFVYDIVKQKMHKENENDYRDSRDLDRVLFGNNIMCPGYSKYNIVLLSFFDILGIMVVSSEKKHALSLVYIKDDKYNIDGFLALDATNDSRTEEDNIEYLGKYNHFATSLIKEFNIFPIEKLQAINLPLDKLIEMIHNNNNRVYMLLQTLEILLKISGKENYKEIVNNILNYNLLSKADKKLLINDYQLFMKKLFNTSIDMSTFIRALYNTRRIEYYIGMVHEIDIDNIKDSSVNWKMYHTSEEIGEDTIKRFLFRLGAYKYLEDNTEQLISSSLKDNPTIERDILNMRLVKVLKRSLNIKSDNNPNIHS